MIGMAWFDDWCGVDWNDETQKGESEKLREWGGLRWDQWTENGESQKGESEKGESEKLREWGEGERNKSKILDTWSIIIMHIYTVTIATCKYAHF